MNDIVYLWHVDKHRRVLQADSIILGVYRQACPKYPKKSLYFCNISRKAWGMKLIFWLLIKAKVFYKLIVSLGVYVSKHAQSTQNSKFAISLQYLKYGLKDKGGFSPADKYQRFLQIDFIILGVCGQTCPSHQK